MDDSEAPPSKAPPPNRLSWPPIAYLGAVVAAVVLQVASPLAFPAAAKAPLALLGLGLLVGGVGLVVVSIRTLNRARTTVQPHRAASALVTDGPYRRSRNPIYLGNTLALVGLSLVFDVPWFLVTAPLATLAVQELAIKPEERHLAARFGEAWRSYAGAVRRWI